MLSMTCSCGKSHSAHIEHILIEHGAIEKFPEVVGRDKKLYMISDETTYQVAGQKLEQICKKNGICFSNCILNGSVIADAATVVADAAALGNMLIQKPDDNIDMIVAVGSGTINDLCRFMSYKLGIPYGVVGTAPSMDGYASTVSPLIVNDTKVTFGAQAPIFIIGDTGIQKDAPLDMMLAGFGDMMGKYMSLLDWQTAHIVTGEYYCDKVAGLVRQAVDQCIQSADGLIKRDEEAVGNLMKGLVLSGVAMSYVGNSRPASGAEHHISHYWEVEYLRAGKQAILHGLKVAQGTLLSMELYRRFLEIPEEDVPEGRVKSCLRELKSVIEEQLPTAGALEEIYDRVQLKPVIQDGDLIKTALHNAMHIRPRYTILSLLSEVGMLEKVADDILKKQEIVNKF